MIPPPAAAAAAPSPKSPRLTHYPITDSWVTQPERPKGGKDKELEVGARRAPRLLVLDILMVIMINM